MSRPKPKKDLENALWVESFPNQLNGKCCYCKGLVTPFTKQIGHIIPFSMGGPMTIDNLVILCGSCNGSMGAENFNDYCDRTRVIPLIRKNPKMSEAGKKDDLMVTIINKLRLIELSLNEDNLKKSLKKLTIEQIKYLSRHLFNDEIKCRLKDDVIEQMVMIMIIYERISINIIQSFNTDDLIILYKLMYFLYDRHSAPKTRREYLKIIKKENDDIEDIITKVIDLSLDDEAIDLTQD